MKVRPITQALDFEIKIEPVDAKRDLKKAVSKEADEKLASFYTPTSEAQASHSALSESFNAGIS